MRSEPLRNGNVISAAMHGEMCTSVCMCAGTDSHAVYMCVLQPVAMQLQGVQYG